MRGITLDGGNQAEALIVLYSSCPGARLENLQLRNAGKYGIWVTSCAGTADNRVQLLNLDFQTPARATALRFDVQPHHKAIPQNRFFTIRNCSFNGPGRKITTPNPQQVDDNTIELPTGVQFQFVP
jgi:hypothetical protein